MKATHKKIGLFPVFLCIGLIVYAACIAAPLLYGFLTSLKVEDDYILNATGFPHPVSFDNYIQAFQGFYVITDSGKKVYFEILLLNSGLYALGSAFMSVAVPCIAAYVVANYNYKICTIVKSFVIISIVIPIVGSLPSELQLAQNLGLYNNFFGVWLMSGHIRTMYFLILCQTFKAFPKGYSEAAAIDGAGEFTVFFKIIIPLAKNALLTIMLIKLIEFWNDYQTPLIFMPENPTLAYGLHLFRFNTNTEYATTPMMMTGCMLVFLPIFALFMVFKNRIIGNLTIGGLKG